MPLNVVVKAHGEVIRTVGVMDLNMYTTFGTCTLVNVKGTGIDIIVASVNKSYENPLQFEKAGISDWTMYDIVVVKQGYIFPHLKEKAAWYVMSLTDGATYQNTAKLPFKLVMRPMFPIDDM